MDSSMPKAILFVAIGGNNIVEGYHSLIDGLQAAVEMLPQHGIEVQKISHWYKTAAVPISDQPDFLNAVLRCETDLEAHQALRVLQEIEAQFGRIRTVKNAERTVDLDIIDFGQGIFVEPSLTLPHPRLQDRAFVLYPLRDVAPDWVHPISHKAIAQLIRELPEGQDISKFKSN